MIARDKLRMEPKLRATHERCDIGHADIGSVGFDGRGKEAKRMRDFADEFFLAFWHGNLCRHGDSGS